VIESPDKNSRDFAVSVVRKLRDAGYEALWAGGCVRDALLGIEPSDYDVATNATPDQIRQCFGRKRTLAIGAAFGVITVLGRKGQAPVEVATFRQDAPYSDGRHPDHVTFSTAEQDAQRRDFTINGLFYDPLKEELVDYVGGREDLNRGIIRAIRDPFERFEEDKLRLLRAVRFAATFNFEMDPETFEAVKSKADQITVVSAERIAAEMRRILVHPHRTVAVRMLQTTGLLSVLLPESKVLENAAEVSNRHGCDYWTSTLAILSQLDEPSFRVGLAGLLWGIYQLVEAPAVLVNNISRRWRLSNDESKGAAWLLAKEGIIRRASRVDWPALQALLIDESVEELLLLARAVASTLQDNTDEIEFCRQKLSLPSSELNPEPLITGDDLRREGMVPGPAFRHILETVRNAQLNGDVESKQQAIELARRIGAEPLN
jgi:tRNA nucleotidyltransferase/poly(A) polymerase